MAASCPFRSLQARVYFTAVKTTYARRLGYEVRISGCNNFTIFYSDHLCLDLKLCLQARVYFTAVKTIYARRLGYEVRISGCNNFTIFYSDHLCLNLKLSLQARVYFTAVKTIYARRLGYEVRISGCNNFTIFYSDHLCLDLKLSLQVIISQFSRPLQARVYFTAVKTIHARRLGYEVRISGCNNFTIFYSDHLCLDLKLYTFCGLFNFTRLIESLFACGIPP